MITIRFNSKWKIISHSIVLDICHVVEEAAEHSDSDTEESEFVPDTDNTDDEDNDGGDSSNHSDSNSDDDDDMENLLFELSDMSNFWMSILPTLANNLSDLAWL